MEVVVRNGGGVYWRERPDFSDPDNEYDATVYTAVRIDCDELNLNRFRRKLFFPCSSFRVLRRRQILWALARNNRTVDSRNAVENVDAKLGERRGKQRAARYRPDTWSVTKRFGGESFDPPFGADTVPATRVTYKKRRRKSRKFSATRRTRTEGVRQIGRDGTTTTVRPPDYRKEYEWDTPV